MTKTALIWGGAGGIGKALISSLKADGWQVAAVARDELAIAKQADFAFEANFADPASVERAALSISMSVDLVDLWIYAAGDISMTKLPELSPEELNRIVSANLTGPIVTLHHSLPLLREDAHVVLLGAVSERLALPGLSAYAAAKSGLESFAAALAKEQRKMRVTVVRPGAVATPFWDRVPLKLPADAAPPEKVAKRILEAYASGHKGQLDLV